MISVAVRGGAGNKKIPSNAEVQKDGTADFRHGGEAPPNWDWQSSLVHPTTEERKATRNDSGSDERGQRLRHHYQSVPNVGLSKSNESEVCAKRSVVAKGRTTGDDF